MLRSLVLCSALAATASFAGSKVIQNDTFTGSGGVFAGLSFAEFQGAGVLFEPAPAEYPLTILGIDVLCVAPMQQGSGIGAYEVDVYDETSMNPAPAPNDAGVWPDFALTNGRLARQGVQLTTSNSTFNRFMFMQPITVASGRVFVQVTQQSQTSFDNTTLALDNATSTRPGANWFFDGFGFFHSFDQGDGGHYMGLNRNWIIRLVVQAPDNPVTVTSITPNSSLTTESPRVVITGTNFELGAQAFLGTNALTLNNLTGTTVAATVPSGLPVGVYDVKVRNMSGVEGVLSNGYTVLAADGGMPVGGGGGTGGGAATGGGAGTGGGTATGGGAGTGGGGTGNEALSLTGITPKETYAEDATSLFLTGAGFKPGASVLLGGTRLDSPVVESGGVISAALPANLMPAGTYDVSVINLNGEQATLSQAFKVLPGGHAAPKGCSCNETEGLVGVAITALGLLRRRVVVKKEKRS